jgi:hypothetical protein
MTIKTFNFQLSVDSEKLSKIRQQVTQLRAQQDTVLRILLDCGPMIVGSLYDVFRKCGKRGCRCTMKQPHGPFKALSYSIGGKHKNKSVRVADVAQVQEKTEAYRNFQDALTKWRSVVSNMEERFNELRPLLKEEYQ